MSDYQLNEAQTIMYEGRRCRITFDPGPFEPSGQTVSLGAFHVILPVESKHSAFDFEADQPTAAVLEEFTSSAEVASRLADRYVEAARRQLRQVWIAPALAGAVLSGSIRVRETGGIFRPVALGFGPIRLTSSGSVPVSAETRDRLRRWVESDSEIGAADQVLADVRYISVQRSPDWRQLALFAAIACEMKIKEVLTDSATRTQSGLLELLLNRPRDWSMAAAALYDHALDAVCGRSLKRDDRDLYKKVNSLFEDRNKVAHRGQPVDSSLVSAHALTAERAFGYLEEVRRFVQDPTRE